MINVTGGCRRVGEPHGFKNYLAASVVCAGVSVGSAQAQQMITIGGGENRIDPIVLEAPTPFGGGAIITVDTGDTGEQSGQISTGTGPFDFLAGLNKMGSRHADHFGQ